MTEPTGGHHSMPYEIDEIRAALPKLWNLALTKNGAVWEDNGSGHTKAPHAPAPWNQWPAHLAMDVHAGVRAQTRALTVELWGSVRSYGGSDNVTDLLLEELVQLVDDAEVAVPGSEAATSAARAVTSWAKRCRDLIGHARLDKSVPCAAETCDRLAVKRALCDTHFRAATRAGIIEPRQAKACAIGDCEGTAVARGYCDSHRKKRDRGQVLT